MKAIGGYYELELAKGDFKYHTTPFTFRSGRSSLHYILRLVKPSLVYVPFYTCNGLLESFAAAGIPYRFYTINHLLEPVELPLLKKDEYFLYVNYFDLKRQFVHTLSIKYQDKLIVDCTLAFFMKGNGRSWFFNSCRKYFGVPDGSYLYAPDDLFPVPVEHKNEDYIVSHLIERFNGHPEKGYQLFLKNETLCGPAIMGMSKLSEHLLSHVNYPEVICKRRANYHYLNSRLEEQNFMLMDSYDLGVPMVFPMNRTGGISNEALAGKNVFVPVYWKDVLLRKEEGYENEKQLTTSILPLPVDHRYGTEDMERIIKLLKKLS